MVGVLILFVVEAIVAIALAEILMRNLPRTIRETMAANSRRLDGSFSSHRRKSEGRELKKLRQNVIVGFALTLLPLNLGVSLFHLYVIPLPLGMEAMLNWRLSPDEWKESIRSSGVGSRFDHWKMQRPGGASGKDREAARQLLWRMWPALLGVIVLWLVISFMAVQSFYLAALKVLKRGVDYRSQQYMYRDVSRFSEL